MKNESRVADIPSARTPPSRERIPLSLQSSHSRIRTQSPSTGYSPSITPASGSDTDLSRTYSSSGSMRRQLLQRLWSREIRRSMGRTSSLSPPVQRTQRFRRGWRQLDNHPDICTECQKLESQELNRFVPEMATIKRAKYSASSHSMTSERNFDVSIKRKSYSMESKATVSMITNDKVPSNRTMSEERLVTATTTTTTAHSNEMNINEAANLLNKMNGNFVSSTDFNENTATMSNDTNTFLIEIEGDQINITTSGDEQASTTSQQSEDNNSNSETSTHNGFTKISCNQSNDNNKNQNNNEHEHFVPSTESSSSAIFGNTSTTVSHTDQSAIDSFISQILVDSLNNIIVVEGNINEAGDKGNLSATINDKMPSESRRIYFPQYQNDDVSSEYSAKYSNASNDIELPRNIVISVISGSSYPMDGGEMIVHRLTDFPRTDSMEVQPSSASPNGDTIKTHHEDDEDSISLVDSLDDPIYDKNKQNDFIEIPKSETFFVPIVEKYETNGETTVSEAMPDKLRERLERRQAEINQRKEDEMKRKQEHIQKIIEKNELENIDYQNNNNKIIDEANDEQFEKKKSNKVLREEINMLESYTVDAQGNLLFNQKAQNHKCAKIIKPIVAGKRPIVKKITSKKPPIVPTQKTRSVVAVRRSTSKPIGALKSKRDIQQMTLYHHPNADTITPDTECGPRRMYQKTEIREGAKRIEILEIVECANSSDGSISFKSSRKSKSSTEKSSKIPVPVIPSKRTNRSKIYIGTNGMYTRQSTNQSSVGKNFTKNLQQIGNNSKVDQIIADLLIEALNNSTDIGIEFIKTPASSISLSPNSSTNSKRFTLTTSRRTGGKKSAQNSSKYQQIFDAIPEEKSSLSIDSVNDDVTTTNTTPKSSNASTQQNESSDVRISIVSSGKAAVQSDQDKPEVWFGCFGQSHNESPTESIIVDEGIFKSLQNSNVLIPA